MLMTKKINLEESNMDIEYENCFYDPLSCYQVPQKSQNALNYSDCRIQKHCFRNKNAMFGT
jgi:hypothetical protein